MKSVDELIRRARYRTKNTNYTYDPVTGVYTAGVSTELFLDHLNDAQGFLQSKIIEANSNLFIENAVIAVVGRRQDYVIPDRVFGNSSIIAVQYNSNSNTTDYGEPLKKREPRDRSTSYATPDSYIPYSGKIGLCPIPDNSGGYIRPEYYRELDDLDISRGVVSSVPGGAPLTFVLSAAPVPDRFALENAAYVCISDRWGNVMLRNGLVVSYVTATRTITLAANVSTYLVSPYTTASLVTGYVTVGAYTTTVSKLPDTCESYLRIYTQKRTMAALSDNDSGEEDQELLKLEEAILAAYANEDREVEDMTILDTEIME